MRPPTIRPHRRSCSYPAALWVRVPGVAGVLLVLLLLTLGVRPVAAQDTALCGDAHAHLEEVAGMAAIIEPDTIDDWRTDQLVPGCRVTASGATSLPQRDVVVEFYEELEAAGWTRTPDPRDAPNEASLRFRRNGADCLFNYYTDGMLLTEAEEEVDNRVPLIPGQERYNFLVMCTPAMEAAP